jgi:deoxyribonuclease V
MLSKRYKNFNVAPKEAVKIQKELAAHLRTGEKVNNISKIAGVDVSFVKDKALCAICVFSYPEMNLLEEKTVLTGVKFPYVPTLLTYREAPPVLKCFGKIKRAPDLLMFDGQGIAHPRRMGLASHMGIILDIPSIGCAKSRLFGEYESPGQKKGSFEYLRANGDIIGACVRTRGGVKPQYVSIGHIIGLKQAISVVLKCCRGYKIPEPLRRAHNISKQSWKT